MAFDFKVGKFINGAGLESALSGIGAAIESRVNIQVGRLKGAFVFGGHANRGGEQWAPWSPSYARQARWEASHGQRHPSLMILYRTGQMRASIGPRVVNMAGPEFEMAIEASPSYSSVHQHGAGRIPARPFLVMTEQDQAVFDTGIGTWAHAALNGNVKAA